MSGGFVNFSDVRRRVAERVRVWNDEDLAVRVEPGRHDTVHVTIGSGHPHTYFTQWVDLRPDGLVELPAPDDGFTSVGAKGTTAGTVTTDDEAVEAVVRAVQEAVATLRERQAQDQAWHQPAEQPTVSDAELAEACAMWQGGRDIGSSLIRGAARALTGIEHYFRADFVRGFEQEARQSPRALRAGIVLLRAVNGAERRDADGWAAATELPTHGFAGRGLASKPAEDGQILHQLEHGHITMPLWGVSLDRTVAEGFGTRFLLEIVGGFPAVPAWKHSGIKDDEQELITGGEYRVRSLSEAGGTSHARLEWIGASGDKVAADEVLLGVLGALPGITRSSLTRAGHEELEVSLEGSGNWATVRRTPGQDHVEVVRYWEPDPGWGDVDDSVYSRYLAVLKGARTTTVPADLEAIVAAILAER